MVSSKRRNLWALGGVLFAAFFVGSDFLRGALANGPLPLPGASVGEFVRYFTESRTAALAAASVQVLSALSLLVFVAPVAALARRVADERGSLPGLVSGGGILSAGLLLASALLALALALTASESSLGLVDALRGTHFLTGGTLHVAFLGLFVGATSVAARRAKALPRRVCRLGIVQASLLFFPAALLILLGRMLGFVWCVAVGIVSALDGRRIAGAGR